MRDELRKLGTQLGEHHWSKAGQDVNLGIYKGHPFFILNISCKKI